jgi:hypothetical protein
MADEQDEGLIIRAVKKLIGGPAPGQVGPGDAFRRHLDERERAMDEATLSPEKYRAKYGHLPGQVKPAPSAPK